jgi:hypothetical protein
MQGLAAVLLLAALIACSDRSTEPEEQTPRFEGILEMDWHCNTVGGDTTDFQPRPEGRIDTTVVPPIVGQPTNYSLMYACPNPAQRHTSITWQIPETDSVWIVAYSQPDRPPIDTLYSSRGFIGTYTIEWDFDGPPGIYRVVMHTASGFSSYGDILFE